MKKFILNLLIIIFSTSLFAKNNKEYTITIAVNLEDCINCNKALYDLKKLRKDYYLQIVIPEIYLEDSVKIFDEYEFNTLSDTIIWDDKLHKEYSPLGASVASLESKYKTGKFTEIIANIYRGNFFEFLSWQLDEKRELFSTHPYITKGIADYLYTSNGLLITQNNFQKKIDVYDYIKQEKLYTIKFDDSVRKKAFGYNSFDFSEEEYEKHMQHLKDSGVKDQYLISKLNYINDTLIVYFKTYFLKNMRLAGDEEESEYLVEETSLIKYKNGELLSVHKIENFKETDKGWRFIYLGKGVIPEKSESFYATISLSNKEYPNAIIKQRPFLAKFEKNEKGTYEMEVYEDRPILELYDLTRDYSFPEFSGNIYYFAHSNNLYDLKTGEVVDSLTFYKEFKEETAKILPDAIKLDHGLMVTEDYIWSIALEDEKIFLYKMNRSTREYVSKNIELPERLHMLHIRFDPLNPDFVIYNKENKIIRKKIF